MSFPCGDGWSNSDTYSINIRVKHKEDGDVSLLSNSQLLDPMVLVDTRKSVSNVDQLSENVNAAVRQPSLLIVHSPREAHSLPRTSAKLPPPSGRERAARAVRAARDAGGRGQTRSKNE